MGLSSRNTGPQTVKREIVSTAAGVPPPLGRRGGSSPLERLPLLQGPHNSRGCGESRRKEEWLSAAQRVRLCRFAAEHRAVGGSPAFLRGERAQASQKVRASRDLADTLMQAGVEARGQRRRPRCRRYQRRVVLPRDRRATGFTMVDRIPRSDVRRRRNWAGSAAKSSHHRVAASRWKRGSTDVLVRSIPRQACTW